ncbi:peptidoglycan-binding domain-containing protein [Sedimentibacter sp. MB31-C6]|uniref:peptidoglycan-binding domain-containing protein n=1 Tax=Sedimentibacter sp. MB31-C6 TaxID=3109366 RepID=UPI002DDD92D2|nr:peptidoglycan-binding protein [Sedimentibacter sp. MB36-C1]WSI03783.1 peptidoglycan-binding protein [Sedimentibacter sp. MB36-C1]
MTKNILDIDKRENPVLELQLYLIDISKEHPEIPRILPSGTYDARTKEAVIAFQEYSNLPVTGTVDYNTWNSIVKMHKQCCQTPNQVACFPSKIKELKYGDEETVVYFLQLILNNFHNKYKNFPPVSITGKYDRETEAAVKEFQKSNNLPVTGMVNIEAWNSLTTINNVCRLYDN